MSLKKSYVEKYGLEHVITDRNSSLTYLEVDMLMLESGKSHAFDEQGKEFVLVVLKGSCAVEGEGFSFPKVGKRDDVFKGPAETVYVGSDAPFTVKANTDVKIAVCKAPAHKRLPARHITADKVRTKTLGKGSYVRDASFIYDENAEAELLYIGEFWVDDGNWASYPPHKHDVENMPVESFSDEIYYYEFDKPQGFGVQMVYAADGTLDEAYRVQNGDFVEIPKGYHPFSVAPGYKNYCLWIMAGRNRGIFCSTQAPHEWLK